MKRQKKRKVIKFLIKFTTLVIILFIFGFTLNYLSVTNNSKLESSKLTKAMSTQSMQLIDSNNTNINVSSLTTKLIKISDLNKHTIDAFLTSEDRNFYNHSGIDYKRIVGALLKNIKSGKIKQGGSTISQQLIKNTHLSSEKTLNRKLKEFKLTKELEKKYTKDQILEIYLNTIYFGNGIYGLENASEFYFGKSAKNLSVAESAMLAGIISSPTNNEPINHKDKAIRKKDLILKNMQNLGKISKKELENAQNQELIIKKHKNNDNNQYLKSVIHEAVKLLNISENQLINHEYKIYTSLDTSINNFANTLVNNKSFTGNTNDENSPIVQTIILDNNTNSVIAYATNKSYNVENIKRQPGSSIKPILVYAPAFEYNKITPSSFILDEETTFGNYTPKNSNNKYSGWTTVRNAIVKSLNIPAVKTLSYVGIEKAINFASNLGLAFDKNDNHLAIALGGLTNGTTVKELADAYKSFANSGTFSKSSFITKIVDSKNRTIYQKKDLQKQVMSEETAYMITDTLISAVKNGTAKKLNIDDIQIASKTGTTNDNKEAWNVCYTSSHTIVTFIGNSDHTSMNQSINGSTYPTLIARELIKKLYEQEKPTDFEIPSGIIKANLDKQDLDNTKNNLSLDQKVKSDLEEIFTKDTLPSFNSESNIEIKLNITNEKNKPPILKISSKNAKKITIYKEYNNKTAVLKEFTTPTQIIELNDPDTQKDTIYTYFIEAENDTSKVSTNKIKIKIY